MIILILTIEQKDFINGFEVDGNLVMPTQDGNGNYFITQAQGNMLSPYFEWVKELPQAEYVPPINNIE